MRLIVAGSVPRRCARARTLKRTNSRGRSKVGRMMACRFGLNRPRRADGLITWPRRVTFRRVFIEHKSMLESDVLVNRVTSAEQHGFCFAAAQDGYNAGAPKAIFDEVQMLPSRDMP